MGISVETNSESTKDDCVPVVSLSDSEREETEDSDKNDCIVIDDHDDDDNRSYSNSELIEVKEDDTSSSSFEYVVVNVQYTTDEEASNLGTELESSVPHTVMDQTGDSGNSVGAGRRIRTFKCNVCDMSFGKKAFLNVHKRTHQKVNENNETGEENDILVDTESPYNSDLIRFQPCVCKICYMTFSNVTSLNIHKRTHTTVATPFSCKICDKNFATLTTWKAHESLHRNQSSVRSIDNFQCTLCAEKFGSEQCFDDHRKKVHPELFPFVCKICHASFESEVKLDHHTRLTCKRTKKVCRVCGKSFFGSMHKHQRSHVKKFICKVCRETFVHKKALVYHVRTKHKCDVCGGLFNKDILLVHKETHSDAYKKCIICSILLKKENVIEHMLLHNASTSTYFGCEKCSNYFDSEVNLTFHKEYYCKEES